MFSWWTANSLTKISYYFSEDTFNRKQYVYREGDKTNRIYFCTAGEFRLTRKFVDNRNSSKKKLAAFFSPRPVVKHIEADILSIGPGEVFGEVEINELPERITSCVAMSNDAAAISIPLADWTRRIHNRRSKEYFKKEAPIRLQYIEDRIEELATFY